MGQRFFKDIETEGKLLYLQVGELFQLLSGLVELGAEVVLFLEGVHALLEVDLQPLVALSQQLVHRGRQPLVVLLIHLEGQPTCQITEDSTLYYYRNNGMALYALVRKQPQKNDELKSQYIFTPHSCTNQSSVPYTTLF